jgi:hypothetical protein
MHRYVLKRYGFRDTRRRQMVHDNKGLNHWLAKLQQDVSFQPLVFTCPTTCWRSVALKPHLPHSQKRKSMQKTCQKITTSLDSQHVRKQIGAHDYVPNSISPHVNDEMNLIPTLINKLQIIPAKG